MGADTKQQTAPLPSPAVMMEEKQSVKKGFITTLDVKKGSYPPAKFNVKRGEQPLAKITQKLTPDVKKGNDDEQPNLTPDVKRGEPNLTSEDLPNLMLHALGGTKIDYNGQGRELGFSRVIEMLTYVYNHKGAWPSDPYQSPPMRRYYRRRYPWFFAKFDAIAQEALEKLGFDEKTAAQFRARDQEKAEKLRRQNRPSRSKVDKAERGVKKGNNFTTKFDAAGRGTAATEGNRGGSVKKGSVKKGSENVHGGRPAPVDIRTRRAKA